MRATDQGDPEHADTATFSILVSQVNDPPEAYIAPEVETYEGANVTIEANVTDVDVGSGQVDVEISCSIGLLSITKSALMEIEQLSESISDTQYVRFKSQLPFANEILSTLVSISFPLAMNGRCRHLCFGCMCCFLLYNFL